MYVLPDKTTFSLAQITNEVYNIVKPIAVKKDLTIKLQYNNDIEIFADYAKIQQVLFNIITNAIKYTNENGKITISFSKNKNYASISIKDNGIGIDKKYHKKIFKKFMYTYVVIYAKSSLHNAFRIVI